MDQPLWQSEGRTKVKFMVNLTVLVLPTRDWFQDCRFRIFVPHVPDHCLLVLEMPREGV